MCFKQFKGMSPPVMNSQFKKTKTRMIPMNGHFAKTHYLAEPENVLGDQNQKFVINSYKCIVCVVPSHRQKQSRFPLGTTSRVPIVQIVL